MTADRPVSQHDVAARLGLGQKTVSRVFGGGPVSEVTRERVLRAAHDLGYRPNAGARAMRTGRTGSVVLLQSTRESASNLPDQLLAGLAEALAAADANLVLARFDDQRLLEPGRLPKALRELTGDGVLVNYDTDVPAGLERVLRGTGLPVVWINHVRGRDAVRPDDHAAGALLARRLIDAGHRRLGWADLHSRWTPMRHYSRDHRRDGFITAAVEAGIPVEDWEPEVAMPDPADWFAQRLTSTAPTAIACYSEVEFLALLRATARIGRRVPEDLSLAGVMCGLLIGTQVDSAVFNLRVLGRLAAEALLARIAGAPRAHSSLLAPHLLSGGTVVPPRPIIFNATRASGAPP